MARFTSTWIHIFLPSFVKIGKVEVPNRCVTLFAPSPGTLEQSLCKFIKVTLSHCQSLCQVVSESWYLWKCLSHSLQCRREAHVGFSPTNIWVSDCGSWRCPHWCLGIDVSSGFVLSHSSLEVFYLLHYKPMCIVSVKLMLCVIDLQAVTVSYDATLQSAESWTLCWLQYIVETVQSATATELWCYVADRISVWGTCVWLFCASLLSASELPVQWQLA